MPERTLVQEENEFESIAKSMIEKYPGGYLTGIEVGWPCKSAIRAPVAGLDTPRVIFTGSYQELNAFEHAFHRARRAAKESESIRPAGKWPGGMNGPVDKMLGEA
jgi:hypothetical protein